MVGKRAEKTVLMLAESRVDTKVGERALKWVDHMVDMLVLKWVVELV